MVLEIPGGIFGQSDVRETPAGSSTSSSSIIAPIGTIMAWLKTLVHTPQVLPTGWVECDGAVVSDADSVYDGDTLPDLNGGEFMRGFTTSGGTGGSDTMAHTHGVTSNVAVGNHIALTVNGHTNHTALTLNTDQHNHSFSDTSDNPSATLIVNNDAGATRTVASNFHTHDVSGTTNNDTHGHTFSQNIDAHSAHAFGQNISNHSVTNNGVTSDAASNDANIPKYYNVVWIIRIK